MVSYDEFRKIVIKELKNLYPEYRVLEEQVRKVNRTYYGIVIKSNDENCAPVIELTEYYQKYLNKEMTLQEILWDIWDKYRESLNHVAEVRNCIQSIKDFNIVKNMIYCKLINRSMNRDSIDKMPCKFLPSLDLICTYYIDFGKGMVCTVSNNILDYWGVTENEIYNVAISNMKKNCIPYCTKIEQILEEEYSWFESRELPMWVVGLERDENPFAGASIILLEEMLNDILDKNHIPDDCYIIPSSIHEIIIIPVNGKVAELNKMIKSINEEMLLKSEILSDVGFYFNRKKNEMCMLKWTIKGIVM